MKSVHISWFWQGIQNSMTIASHFVLYWHSYTYNRKGMANNPSYYKGKEGVLLQVHPFALMYHKAYVFVLFITKHMYLFTYKSVKQHC